MVNVTGCTGKCRFGTKSRAKFVASRAARLHPANPRQHPYRCRFCRAWHLTSMNAEQRGCLNDLRARRGTASHG